MPNPFKVLGLNPNASEDDIRKAWKQLALKYHPDRNFGKDTTEKMKEINNAKDLLLDPEKRRIAENEYRGNNQNARTGDQSNSSKSKSSSGSQKTSGGWNQQWAGSDWDEKQRRPKMEKNVHVEVRITPKRAKLGGYIKIRDRYAYGPANVPIQVPSNVHNGLERLYKGWGQYGDDQNTIGDLVVTFIIDPNAKDSGKDFGDFASQSRTFDENAEVIDEDFESDPFDTFRDTYQQVYEETQHQYSNFQSSNYQRGNYGSQSQNFQSARQNYSQPNTSQIYTQGAMRRFVKFGGIALLIILILSQLFGSSNSSNISNGYANTDQNSGSYSSGNDTTNNSTSETQQEPDAAGSIGLTSDNRSLDNSANQDSGATGTIGE
jgi:curved DNA-binding protein CbpA